MSVSTSVKHLKIASRQSVLALWQSEFIKAELDNLYSQFKVDIVGMTPQGDRILDAPLATIGAQVLLFAIDTP